MITYGILEEYAKDIIAYREKVVIIESIAEFQQKL